MVWRLLALAEQLDDGLLRQVFTHSSWVAERGRSYERLEFLGDSVLSLAVTTELYRRFPEHSEGSLARLRAYVVSRATCAKVADEAGPAGLRAALRHRSRAGRARPARRQREHPRRHDRVADRCRLPHLRVRRRAPGRDRGLLRAHLVRRAQLRRLQDRAAGAARQDRPLGHVPAGRDDRAAARAQVRARGGRRRRAGGPRGGCQQEARRAGGRGRGPARVQPHRQAQAAARAPAGPAPTAPRAAGAPGRRARGGVCGVRRARRRRARGRRRGDDGRGSGSPSATSRRRAGTGAKPPAASDPPTSSTGCNAGVPALAAHEGLQVVLAADGAHLRTRRRGRDRSERQRQEQHRRRRDVGAGRAEPDRACAAPRCRT